MRRAKISVIGGGNVGASCALWAASKELGDIVVLDIPSAENLVKGKMLDLAQCGPVEIFDSSIIATADYKDTADSDVVIVTAGIPRKPGMSRDDLIATNVKIVKSVAEQVATHSPDAIMIIVSNPLDAMVFTAWRASGFPTNQIVGQAGCLDVARYKTFIAQETGFSVEDINALLLGGHGDTMVPLPRYTNISGIPISNFISEDRLNEIIERAKMGGGEIVKLMGTSAYYAPASGSVQMAEAIIKDKKRILPCAAYCDGQYGIDGYFIGVPAVIGAGGVEKVIEIDLNDDEKALMENSYSAVKELVEIVKTTFPELAEATV
ncbi:MAG: malate dehydrogenase [Planctomycetota bacterium]|nr:malate dehydrogenase [Planctomycetota bacterium]